MQHVQTAGGLLSGSLSSKSTGHGCETWRYGMAERSPPEWLALANSLHHCQKPQYVQFEKYMNIFF